MDFDLYNTFSNINNVNNLLKKELLKDQIAVGGQFDILNLLNILRQPVTQKYLAQVLRISAASVTTFTMKLREKGLVAFIKNPIDMRRTYITITPLGKKVLKQHSARYVTAKTSISNLSSEEIYELNRLLEKILGVE